MSNITGIAPPAVLIWPYVKELADENIISPAVYQKHLVEMVYQNEDHTFDHFLLPTEQANIFIVILVDLRVQQIKGHYRLDLNELYGIE